jgi:hypothetical protein
MIGGKPMLYEQKNKWGRSGGDSCLTFTIPPTVYHTVAKGFAGEKRTKLASRGVNKATLWATH